VSLLAAASDESVFARVNEGVHTLLMEIEGFILLVDKVLDVMDVDEAVQGGGDDVVQVGEKLNFSNPTVVNLFFNNLDSVLLLLKGSWFLLKQRQYLIRL
jgi:hypothetical protein